MNSFGEYIRRKRKELGFPQRKIAAYLDIDTSILSKIERGKLEASVSMLEILADKLELPLDEVEYKFLKDSIIDKYSEMEFLKPCLGKIVNEIN